MGDRGYFQVGGFRGQIQAPRSGNVPPWLRDDDSFLAETLAGPKSPLRSEDNPNAPVELILGIKKSGASYLLITVDDAYACRQFFKAPRNLLRPDDFESLSPIYFEHAEGLKEKLKTYKHKKGPRDDSSANRVYRDGVEDLARGGFELNRVLYRALQRSLDLPKYSVQQGSTRLESVRICTLAFGIWHTDTRKASEKLRTPRLLDIAFADVSIPSFVPGPINHFAVKENATLGSHKNVQPSTEGPAEMLESFQIGERISQFLSRGASPIILLVFDSMATEHALKHLGVDIRSLNIRTLLPLDSSRPQYRSRDYEDRRNRGRSRSRSPQRPSGSSEPSSRRRESAGKTTECIMIDIQKIYLTMTRESGGDGNQIFSVSRRLSVSQDRPQDTDRFAGLKVGLLVESWRAMASGPTIDEQHEKWKHSPQHSDPADQHIALAEDMDFEEHDPNDHVQKPTATSNADAYYESDEDSDSD